MNKKVGQSISDIFSNISPKFFSDKESHNTNQTAILSEACFVVWATQRDWLVTRPIFHTQPFDFVVKIGGGWETVQVKTATWQSKGKAKKHKKCLRIKLQRCTSKGKKSYMDGDFDYLFVVNGKCYWLIPWAVLKGLTAITLEGKKYLSYRVDDNY